MHGRLAATTYRGHPLKYLLATTQIRGFFSFTLCPNTTRLVIFSPPLFPSCSLFFVVVVASCCILCLILLHLTTFCQRERFMILTSQITNEEVTRHLHFHQHVRFPRPSHILGTFPFLGKRLEIKYRRALLLLYRRWRYCVAGALLLG